MEQTGNPLPPQDDVNPEENSDARPGPVTLDDLNNVPFEEAIADLGIVECHALGRRFRQKLEALDANATAAERRVYFALIAICEFHFKPEERGEAYGPMMTLNDGRRTAVPDDFRGEQAAAFGEVLHGITHISLRTRLADVVWLNTRNRDAAELAINGYIDTADRLITNEATPRFDLEHSALFEATQQLTRALQIAAATKKRRDDFATYVSDAVRRLVDAAESRVSNEKRSNAFLRAIKLAFNYGMVEPEELIAKVGDIMELRKADAGTDEMRSLYFAIADAHDESDRRAEANEARRLAAEELVREGEGGSGMLASYILMNAIAELRRIPGSKDRLSELEVRLREVQPKVLEEMSPISQKTDITDLVDYTIEQVEGLSLAQALGQFGDLSRSRTQRELKDEALSHLKEFPLSALFGGSKLDDEGRVIAKTPTPNLPGDPGDEWIKSRISENESLYRSIVVQGKIEPARRYIVSYHPLSNRHFQEIVSRSWLIPPAHRPLFALGFARFMQGDFAGATYLLIPQLEHCLRHALKVVGTDPSKIESDLVQKDPTLSVLIERYAEPLTKIFGEDIVQEIDHLFLYPGGPALRHQAAHGKISAPAAHSADAIYACWFIYRLVCLTVYGRWEEVAQAMEETVGDAIPPTTAPS